MRDRSLRITVLMMSDFDMRADTVHPPDAPPLPRTKLERQLVNMQRLCQWRELNSEPLTKPGSNVKLEFAVHFLWLGGYEKKPVNGCYSSLCSFMPLFHLLHFVMTAFLSYLPNYYLGSCMRVLHTALFLNKPFSFPTMSHPRGMR